MMHILQIKIIFDTKNVSEFEFCWKICLGDPKKNLFDDKLELIE